MTQYFENVKTLDELKKQYRRLAIKYHPDMGGSTEIMQQINAEHDRLFEQLKTQHNASGNTKAHKEELKAAGFRWSNNKKQWYWRHEEAGRRWHRGNKTMSEIRAKYGSQIFNGSRESSGYEKIGAAC